MARWLDDNKKPVFVKCPECGNVMKTKKAEDIQCSECKERFNQKGNVIKV